MTKAKAMRGTSGFDVPVQYGDRRDRMADLLVSYEDAWSKLAEISSRIDMPLADTVPETARLLLESGAPMSDADQDYCRRIVSGNIIAG